MAFACIYISGFLLQAVARSESSLRGDRVALALLSGKAPLWSVVAANAAAQRAGVQLGMTKAQVAEFCGVEVRHRSEAQEKAAHAALLDVAWSISPRVEDTAADTIVLDLEGLASMLRKRRRNCARFDGTRGECRHRFQILRLRRISRRRFWRRADFLGSRFCRWGKKRRGWACCRCVRFRATRKFSRRWIAGELRHCRRWRSCRCCSFRSGWGSAACCCTNWRAARDCGRWCWRRRASRLKKRWSWMRWSRNWSRFRFCWGGCSISFARGWSRGRWRCRRFACGSNWSRRLKKMCRSLNDESRKKTAPKEFTKVLTLPVAMRDAKVLLKLLRLSLQSDAPKSPIQKIRMTADAAAPRTAQSGLFVPRGPDPEKLELTVARLTKLVGESNVGVAELIDTHRAENFRVARWTCGAIAAEEDAARRKGEQETKSRC